MWSSSVARLRFLRGFFRHPLAVGSIVPSSRYLSRAVVAPVPATARVVAELGPGTGPITRALLERLGPEATVLALEIDPSFCEVLRRELPDPRLRVIQGPAQRLAERAREAGFPDGVDAVVSGLPFANFPVALRYEMARIAYAGLEVGGVFSAYGYLPFALPPVIRSVFGECHSRHVWRNVPPAFVFSAAKRA
ncbi:MAG TPA: methyltransferase domain-containing protein [Chloroflexota bacterium]|nr:methyltransferase domain-containing protein [Chloroflexota bacterium]